MSPQGGDKPWPGNTYAISEYGTSRVLERYETNKVHFGSYDGRAASQKWKCIEHLGFLCFKAHTESSGDKLLGRNSEEVLVASADEPKEWEEFMVRPDPSGGWLLMMRKWNNDDQKFFPVGKNGSGLKMLHDTSTRFDFTKR